MRRYTLSLRILYCVVYLSSRDVWASFINCEFLVVINNIGYMSSILSHEKKALETKILLQIILRDREDPRSLIYAKSEGILRMTALNLARIMVDNQSFSCVILVMETIEFHFN